MLLESNHSMAFRHRAFTKKSALLRFDLLSKVEWSTSSGFAFVSCVSFWRRSCFSGGCSCFKAAALCCYFI
jgi:hypothetical protein